MEVHGKVGKRRFDGFILPWSSARTGRSRWSRKVAVCSKKKVVGRPRRCRWRCTKYGGGTDGSIAALTLVINALHATESGRLGWSFPRSKRRRARVIYALVDGT